MSKMSLEQFLLLKLGEEVIELSEESLKLFSESFAKNEIDLKSICYKSFLGEYNDVYAVLHLLNIKSKFEYEHLNTAQISEESIVNEVLSSVIPFEQSILILMSRTCLQIDKLCKKAIQFGLLERHPDLALNNQERIHEQLDRLGALINVLEKTIGHKFQISSDSMQNKRKKIAFYLNYSIRLGKVEDGVDELAIV